MFRLLPPSIPPSLSLSSIYLCRRGLPVHFSLAPPFKRRESLRFSFLDSFLYRGSKAVRVPRRIGANEPLEDLVHSAAEPRIELQELPGFVGAASELRFVIVEVRRSHFLVLAPEIGVELVERLSRKPLGGVERARTVVGGSFRFVGEHGIDALQGLELGLGLLFFVFVWEWRCWWKRERKGGERERSFSFSYLSFF